MDATKRVKQDSLTNARLDDEASNAARKTPVAIVVPSLCHGGAERQIVEIARRLDKDAFDIHIVTFSDYVPLIGEDDVLRSTVWTLARSGRFDVFMVIRLAKLFRQRYP